MFPKVNQIIVIYIKSENYHCRSIVAEVRETEILIAFPMDINIIGMLTVGTQLDITFITGENKYKFKTEIIGKEKENILLYRITKPNEKEIIKIQLRENFRVNSNQLLKLDEKELKTINLSAGGVLFSTRMDHQLQMGEEVSGTLFLPNILNKELEPIPFQGKIIRINVIENEDRKNVAVEFTKVIKRDQSKIIQHCFEKQRQLRMTERGSK
jgi:c-di-GMP-binding flagellar brake protein YcgR